MLRMKKSTKLFSIFGIDIKLHYSWWLIFLLLTWSLSTAFFPSLFEGYSEIVYWVMGVAAAILLFVSVLLHELSHSLVAKTQGIGVESITLFFFGGVAAITKEDMKPKSEFLMAIAGPLFSFFFAGVFFLINKLNGNGIVNAITFYLYQLNFILAMFNLLPGYPLDGGRALRAILYAYYKDLKKATKIAASIGRFIAGFLIVLGIFGMFSGGPGLWFILIGAFLYFIAGMSYEQVVLKEVLEKVPVKELISKKIITLDPELLVKDFIKRYSKSGELIFLVGKNNNCMGFIDIERLGNISSKLSDVLRVKQLTIPFSNKPLNSKQNAYQAYRSIAKLKIPYGEFHRPFE